MKTVIEMAQEARLYEVRENPPYFGASEEALLRFAALVRADEREACAKVCEEEKESFMRDAYGSDDGRYDWKADGAMNCAAAIRARSNT